MSESIMNKVVQVVVRKKEDNNVVERGTGFLVGSDVVCTSSHVVKKYKDEADTYTIFVVSSTTGNEEISAVIDSSIEDNAYFTFLKIDNKIEDVSSVKFTLGYEVKKGDTYQSYGFPAGKQVVGKMLDNTVGIHVNEKQSNKIDWELELKDERLQGYEGMSGAPVFIRDMLIGIIQTESTIRGAANNLSMSTVSMFHKLIPDQYSIVFDSINDVYKTANSKRMNIKKIQEIENRLSQSMTPSLSLDFFEADDDLFIAELNRELTASTHIKGKSREETLLSTLCELKKQGLAETIMVVGDEVSWEYLRGKVKGAVLIPDFYVGEIIVIEGNNCIFIYGEDDYCTESNPIRLRRRTRKTITTKLVAAGLEHNEAYNIVEATNGLYAFLKRKMFNGQYNTPPAWSNECDVSFITALLVGKWEDNSADKGLIERVSGQSYQMFIHNLTPYMRGGEPFIIEIERHGYKSFRLANCELAWDYFESGITREIWERFIELVPKVIGEVDPKYYKPFEEHYMIYLKKDENRYSSSIKKGLIRSLIFRSLLVPEQYGYKVDTVVTELLAAITTIHEWAYYADFIVDLCEASPEAVISRFERELKNPTGMFEIFSHKNNDWFFGKNYYTHYLWAVEQLLQYREFAIRSVEWLLIIDDMDIEYSISNSPKSTIEDIFCTWLNKYAISIDEKIRLADYAIVKYKNIWEILFNEFRGKRSSINVNGNRPNFRKTDEIEEMTYAGRSRMNLAFANLCISQIKGDIDKWLMIIGDLGIYPNDMFDNLMVMLGDDVQDLSDKKRCLIDVKLRHEIYRHRFHNTAGWCMGEDRLNKLEQLCKSVDYSIREYSYVYLFNYKHDIPLFKPVPYETEKGSSIKANDELREKEVEVAFNTFKADGLDIVKLAEAVDPKFYHILGNRIAVYYMNYEYDPEMFRKFIHLKNSDSLLIAYTATVYQSGNEGCLKQALTTASDNNVDTELYINLLKIDHLEYKKSPLIMSEPEDIQKEFWQSKHFRFRVSSDKETYGWVLSELYKHDNPITYLEFLYDGMKLFESEEILAYMLLATEMTNYDGRDTMTDYYIQELVEYLNENFFSKNNKLEELYRIEMLFRGALSWREMRTTSELFKSEPRHYADLIDKLYRHEDDEESEEYSDDKTYIQSLYHFYNDVHFCPCEEDGFVDEKKLKEWVEKFKVLLNKQKQQYLFGRELGKLFAYSPVGDDGLYPSEAVRIIIEELQDEDLRNKYVLAESSKRGIYSPNAGRGEREIALRYKEIANGLRIGYPECAKIYDKLYREYTAESKAERRHAEDEY